MFRKNLTVLLLATFATPAFAQERFIGEVYWTSAGFCPRGTLEANGSMLLVSEQNALFSLLGSTYGGNGSTTFALPDLRVAAPVSAGQAPNKNVIDLGQKFGGIGQRLGEVGCPEGEKCSDEYQSYLGLTACMVLYGVYPPRN